MMSLAGQLLGALVGFAVLFTTFAAIEALWPEKPLRRIRRGSGTDSVWFFASYGVRAMASVCVAITVVIVARIIPHPLIPAVSDQPEWLQLIEVLMIGDLIQYWVHRAFHGRSLWRIHAVHHSIEDLDWLAAARVHPLDTISHRILEVVPLFLLGFSSLRVLPAYALILGFYPIFLHANVGWSYGPLRFVIASPAFHRWHHTAETEGFNKNFSGLIPLWDIVFATFYMPGRASATYGLGRGQQMSVRFWDQVAYPFSRENRGTEPRKASLPVRSR